MSKDFYSIDREDFIIRYWKIARRLIRHEFIKKDLIQGGEFIVSAEDILEHMHMANNNIDPTLVGEAEGTIIHAKDCKLVYRHKNR